MYDEIANEFDLGEQFGLDYAGDPAGTQAAVRNIENTVYLPGQADSTTTTTSARRLFLPVAASACTRRTRVTAPCC